MAHTAPLLLRLLASSVSTAKQAGKIIRDIKTTGNLGIIEKGKNDIQTEADRSAQRCIIVSLEKQFPSITYIAEEDIPNIGIPEEWVVIDSDAEVLSMTCPIDLQELKEEEIVVWVDPLDGTTEFTKGSVERVTVLIGIAVAGRPVAGVIHQPYYTDKDSNNSLGRTLWGIKGAGIGGLELTKPPERKRVIVTSHFHFTENGQAVLDSLKPDEVLHEGGAGHKAVLLLNGRAHAYFYASAGCMRWDTCAPEAVLIAAGGQLTDLHGDSYCYDKHTVRKNLRGVLATAPGEDHTWYLSKVPAAVRQKLT